MTARSKCLLLNTSVSAAVTMATIADTLEQNICDGTFQRRPRTLPARSRALEAFLVPDLQRRSGGDLHPRWARLRRTFM